MAWKSILEGVRKTPMPEGENPSKYFCYNPDVYDEEVAEIQGYLSNAGYKGLDGELLPVTGYFDIDTGVAVNSFKQRNGLDRGWSVGVVTNEVYDFMFPAGTASRNTSSKSARKEKKEPDRETGSKGDLNLWLIKDAKLSPKYEMPELLPCGKKPHKAIPFDRCMKTRERNQWVHFFIDDKKFECLWNDPKEYLDLLKSFNHCCQLKLKLTY